MSKSLVFLDLLVVSAFSYGGMTFHDVEGSLFSEFLRVSSPFLIGVLACGWGLGAYDVTEDRARFLKVSGAALLVGLAVSFFLRYCQRGQVPPMSFIVASLVFFLVLTLPLKMLHWKLKGR